MMKKRHKDWLTCISYGVLGLFSLSLFVFGAMFPKYMYVEESFEKKESPCAVVGCRREQVMSLDELRGRDMKVTCLSYECLKEIIDGWD